MMIDVWWLALEFVIIAPIFFIIGMEAVANSWKKECIERDFAKYNEKTGEWVWK